MGIQRNAENQNETHAILNKIYKVFIFPIFDCKKKYIMQMLRILEIDFRCINNQISPGLSEIDPF